MNKVIFSNSNASIRLEYYVGGEKRMVRFERTSSLVNFCRDNGIEVMVENCITEE